MACRVLLTTIPKCGKNVLVSFLSNLGMNRRPGGADVFGAATHAQARWYLQQQDNPAQSAGLRELLTQTAPAFERMVDDLASLPDNSYLLGHFVFDAELHRRVREAGIPIVFLYRDPRASLPSLAHYLLDRNEPEVVARQLPGRDVG